MNWHPYVPVLLVVAAFAVPSLLSYYLVRAIRMPDYFWKVWSIFLR